MATASYTVTITATADTQEEAEALRLSGIRRFVRQNRWVIPIAVGEGETQPDPATMNEAELLPHARAALRSYITECIVADVAADADAVRSGIVAQGRAQTEALSVDAEVVP